MQDSVIASMMSLWLLMMVYVGLVQWTIDDDFLPRAPCSKHNAGVGQEKKNIRPSSNRDPPNTKTKTEPSLPS